MSVRGTHVPEHLRLPIAGVTPPPTESGGQRLFPTGNFRFFRPVYRDKMPPCNNACPTGEQIQKYLDFVKHDRFLDGPAAAGEPDRRDAAPAERQDRGHRGVRARRPGLRLPPAPEGLRQRDLRGHGQAGRDAARRHPALAPARGGPRGRAGQAARSRRHRDPLRGPGRNARPHLGRPAELRRGVPRPGPGRRPPPGRAGQPGPRRHRRAGVPARGRAGPPGADRPPRPGDRRRQHRVRRGPQRDQARRRHGHDRLAGGRGRAGDRAGGPGAGPRRGRAVPAEHLLHGDPERGRARDRGGALPGQAGQGRGG